MTMKDFIKENRQELTQLIGNQLGYVPKEASCNCHLRGTSHYHKPPFISSQEIRLWILNDEYLYRWARREGVRI